MHIVIYWSAHSVNLDCVLVIITPDKILIDFIVLVNNFCFSLFLITSGTSAHSERVCRRGGYVLLQQAGEWGAHKLALVPTGTPWYIRPCGVCPKPNLSLSLSVCSDPQEAGDDDLTFKMVFVVNMDLAMGVGKVCPVSRYQYQCNSRILDCKKKRKKEITILDSFIYLFIHFSYRSGTEPSSNKNAITISLNQTIFYQKVKINYQLINILWWHSIGSVLPSCMKH